MICKDDITQDYLKSILNYDLVTGIFTWLVNRNNRKGVGDIGSVAGSIKFGSRKGEYCYIGIDKTFYTAHRLAWLYVTGDWPVDQIDHRNGIQYDNSWKNIRDADYDINSKNKCLLSNNRSGIHGVHIRPCKRPNKTYQYWYAHINNNKKNVDLYHGTDFFEACCRRKSAENKYGYYPNHGRKYDSSWKE